MSVPAFFKKNSAILVVSLTPITDSKYTHASFASIYVFHRKIRSKIQRTENVTRLTCYKSFSSTVVSEAAKFPLHSWMQFSPVQKHFLIFTQPQGISGISDRFSDWMESRERGEWIK